PSNPWAEHYCPCGGEGSKTNRPSGRCRLGQSDRHINTSIQQSSLWTGDSGLAIKGLACDTKRMLASWNDPARLSPVSKRALMSEQVVGALREALKLSPDNLPLRQHLAETLLGLARFAEAEHEYRQALALAPDNH